jgi:hypothetical protein
LCAEKIPYGGAAFLLGIFEFLVCFVMVNRGEFVVDCVANVVFLLSLFHGLKMRQLFQLYFLRGDVELKTALSRAAFMCGAECD